jgi:hypothetical protein
LNTVEKFIAKFKIDPSHEKKQEEISQTARRRYLSKLASRAKRAFEEAQMKG